LALTQKLCSNSMDELIKRPAITNQCSRSKGQRWRSPSHI